MLTCLSDGRLGERSVLRAAGNIGFVDLHAGTRQIDYLLGQRVGERARVARREQAPVLGPDDLRDAADVAVYTQFGPPVFPTGQAVNVQLLPG